MTILWYVNMCYVGSIVKVTHFHCDTDLQDSDTQLFLNHFIWKSESMDWLLRDKIPEELLFSCQTFRILWRIFLGNLSRLVISVSCFLLVNILNHVKNTITGQLKQLEISVFFISCQVFWLMRNIPGQSFTASDIWFLFFVWSTFWTMWKIIFLDNLNK